MFLFPYSFYLFVLKCKILFSDDPFCQPTEQTYRSIACYYKRLWISKQKLGQNIIFDFRYISLQ